MTAPIIADHYDAELRRHHERLLAATSIGPADRVLDVGCGAGQSTRDMARGAPSGSVLGVDISEEMLERARRLTADAGLRNVAYERGDAQVHEFAPASFDLVVSRFGTMFFADPVAAFTNLARACRRGARLVMMVWQGAARNEWATAIPRSLSVPRHEAFWATPFSLGEKSITNAILHASGFSEVGFTEVREPVYYGEDVDTAFAIVCSFSNSRNALAALDANQAGHAKDQLRVMLAEHLTADGVSFDSRAWIVNARRRADP